MKNHYFIEMTDTFGGEANYCWVHRFIVSASTERGAMRNVGCDRWDAVGACVCYFVEWVDAADIEDKKEQYSRIEVL